MQAKQAANHYVVIAGADQSSSGDPLVEAKDAPRLRPLTYKACVS